LRARAQVHDRVREGHVVQAALAADAELVADVRRAVEVDEVALVRIVEPCRAYCSDDPRKRRRGRWNVHERNVDAPVLTPAAGRIEQVVARPARRILPDPPRAHGGCVGGDARRELCEPIDAAVG
jgi:hypothetical protein